MEYVINACFGGFGINEEWKKVNCKDCENRRSCPTCPELISAIKKKKNVNTKYSRLTVVHIPDKATDYEINDYDGNESVTYVLNGKIHHIYR